MKKICANLMAGLSSTPNGVLLWLKVGEGAATAATAPGKLIIYTLTYIYIICIYIYFFFVNTHPKTNMTGWKIHHERVDVFPIEHGDFPAVMLVFRCVYME